MAKPKKFSFIKKYQTNLIVFGVFLFLALIYIWPLPIVFFTHNPFDHATDNMFIQWIMAWDWHALTHYPWRFFEANMYWPSAHTLAWGDHEFGLMLLTLPFLAMHSVTAAYNALYLLAPLLSAFCLYLFVKETTNNKWAAFWAGLTWGFVGLRFATHPQIFVTQWIPLVLYYLERYRKGLDKKYLWGVGVSSFLAFSIGVYLSIFTVCTLLVYLLGLLVGRLIKFKRLFPALLALAAGAILAAPFYVPSFILNLRHPTTWPMNSVLLNSLSLNDLAPKLPPGHLAGSFLRLFIDKPVTGYLYMGLPLIIGLVVAIAMLFGKLKKISKEQKVLILVFLALAVGSALLSLGPKIRLTAESMTQLRNPAHYLMYWVFPGFKVLRDPSRWVWTYLMGLVIVGSFGMAWVFDLLKTRRAKALLMILIVILVIVEQFPTVRTEHFYSYTSSQTSQWLKAHASEQPVLELPVDPNPWNPQTQVVEGRRMYLSTDSWIKRGSGSTSPYVSEKYKHNASFYSAINTNPNSLNLIRQNGFRYVVVYPQDYSLYGFSAQDYQNTLDILNSQTDFKKVAEFNDGVVYEITR